MSQQSEGLIAKHPQQVGHKFLQNYKACLVQVLNNYMSQAFISRSKISTSLEIRTADTTYSSSTLVGHATSNTCSTWHGT